jgi:transposase
MPTKRSLVHPKFKTKYRVANWSHYDQSLVERGNITLWLSPDAMATWNAKPTHRRGGQRRYSDVAIETALTLRMLLHLPLRQTEGFLRSIFELMGVNLDVPDHTTMSRRSARLTVPLRFGKRTGSINLVIDSSGLSIFGEGQWAAVKHGGKGIQGWRKIHLGVDENGVIVAQALTNSNIDDAVTGTKLIGEVTSKIKAVIADGAYDSRAIYAAAEGRGAKVVVPPDKTATIRGELSRARDRAVRRIRKVGRRQWKKEAGYHRQARVENTFFRLKTILGDRMRARGEKAQRVEAVIACNILNRMTELGRSESYSIGM